MDKKLSQLPIKNTLTGGEVIHILDVNDLSGSAQGTDKKFLIGNNNDDFIEKLEKDEELSAGSGAITYNITNKKAGYLISTGITQINGCTVASAMFYYDGKKYFFKNNTSLNITLKNNFAVSIPFIFPNATDFVLKPNETIEFLLRQRIGLKMEYVGVITSSASGAATSIFFDKNFHITTSETTNYYVGGSLGFTAVIDTPTLITTPSALIESVSTGASQGRLLKLPFNAKVKSVMFTTGDARSLGTLEILVWSNKVNDGQSFEPPVALTEGLIITNKSITLTYGVYKTNIYEGIDVNSATISKGNFLYFAIKGGPFTNGVRNCNLSILIEQV